MDVFGGLLEGPLLEALRVEIFYANASSGHNAFIKLGDEKAGISRIRKV